MAIDTLDIATQGILSKDTITFATSGLINVDDAVVIIVPGPFDIEDFFVYAAPNSLSQVFFSFHEKTSLYSSKIDSNTLFQGVKNAISYVPDSTMDTLTHTKGSGMFNSESESIDVSNTLEDTDSSTSTQELEVLSNVESSSTLDEVENSEKRP